MDYTSNILTVTHYGDEPEENKAVTLSPGGIKAVTADLVGFPCQGKLVKKVEILFLEGDTMELTIGDYDLSTLEKVVGEYSYE